jgi:hypothetical protein
LGIGVFLLGAAKFLPRVKDLKDDVEALAWAWNSFWGVFGDRWPIPVAVIIGLLCGAIFTLSLLWARNRAFARLLAAFRPLTERLCAINKRKTGNDLIGQYAGLATAWNGAVLEVARSRDTGTDDYLAARTLETYIDTIRQKKIGKLESVALPANFGVYARCVSTVLDLLATEVLRSRGTGIVGVWTLLTRPIDKWYNIARDVRESGQSLEQWVRSDFWWEKYKAQVATLKTATSLQMRRIVGVTAEHKRHFVEGGSCSDHLYLFKPTDAPYLTLEQAAAQRSHLVLPQLALDRRVLWALDPAVVHGYEHYPIHLLATCSCGGKGDHSAFAGGNWVEVARDFTHTYHTGCCNGGGRLAPTQPGVFFVLHDVAQPRHLSPYDDVFLVELSEEKQFGIAYIETPGSDDTGIVFLDDNSVRKEIEELTVAWDAAIKAPQHD